jgi:hypothetical protein
MNDLTFGDDEVSCSKGELSRSLDLIAAKSFARHNPPSVSLRNNELIGLVWFELDRAK